jgi:hypothetical protein
VPLPAGKDPLGELAAELTARWASRPAPRAIVVLVPPGTPATADDEVPRALAALTDGIAERLAEELAEPA